MKRFFSIALTVMLLAIVLTGCTEAPLEGKTIETNVVSMTVPEDATELISSDSLQAYSITSEDEYTMMMFLGTVEGTPSTVSGFTESDYETFVAEAEKEALNAFSSSKELANGTVKYDDTYETLKVAGQDAIKMSATVKAENATGFMDIYMTGNDSDSVILYFITQVDSADAKRPNLIKQMLATVAYIK